MIEWIIRRSVANRFLVMMGVVPQYLRNMDHYQHPVDTQISDILGDY